MLAAARIQQEELNLKESAVQYLDQDWTASFNQIQVCRNTPEQWSKSSFLFSNHFANQNRNMQGARCVFVAPWLYQGQLLISGEEITTSHSDYFLQNLIVCYCVYIMFNPRLHSGNEY